MSGHNGPTDYLGEKLPTKSLLLAGGTVRAPLLGLCLGLLAACTPSDERAQGHLNVGRELLASGSIDRAAEEFRKAIQLKKDLVPAWRALAELEEKRRNWPAFASALKVLIETDPRDDASRLKLAKLLLLSGDADAALSTIGPLADSESASAAAVLLKANILLRRKDVAAAVREANRAIAIEPDNAEAATILASESLARGDTKGALSLLSKATETPDTEVGVGLLKGMVYERTKDAVGLEAQLRRLVELQPKAFRSSLVRFLRTNKRDSDAENELRAAVAADPNDVPALMELVQYLSSNGRAEAAERELQARISAGGDVFALELAFADFRAAQGQVGQAIQQLERLAAATTAPERKFEAQLRLASLHLQNKDSTSADPLVAQLLRIDSKNPDALRLRAVLRIERGQLDQAITDLRDALNAQPQSPPLLQLLATALERTGSMELADKYYGDAMRASQFSPAVGLEYASFLQRRGGTEQSERVLNELSTRNPGDVRVLRALAQTMLAKRDWAGAQSVADKVQKLQTQGSPMADMIRAEAFSGQSKLPESLQALQAAANSAPQAQQPINATVRAYLQSKRPDDAEKYLSGILAKEPARAEVHVLMASVQMAKNAPEKALNSILTAIQQQPRNPVGYNALAQLNIARGNLDRAMEAINDGLQQQPDNLDLRLTKSSILLRRKDFDGAIRELEASIARHPNSLVVANDLASLLAEHRTDPASLERAQALGAMLRKSEVPAFKETLGWLSYLRGDYKGAVQLLEEAVAAMPNVAEARYHLGLAYLKAGQVERGREELRRATEYDKDRGSLAEKIAAALRDG